MSEKSTAKSSGVGVLGLLGVLFVALKLLGLTEVATWSWWWVTLPFWIGLVIAAVVMLGTVLVALAVVLLDGPRK